MTWQSKKCQRRLSCLTPSSTQFWSGLWLEPDFQLSFRTELKLVAVETSRSSAYKMTSTGFLSHLIRLGRRIKVSQNCPLSQVSCSCEWHEFSHSVVDIRSVLEWNRSENL